MNVKEFVTQFSSEIKTEGFLGNFRGLETEFPFMEYYVNHHNEIDGKFVSVYIHSVVDEEQLDFMNLLNVNPDATTYRLLQVELVKSIITANYYKYNNLYKSTILDYNLLDNIDLNVIETITDTHGERVHTFNKGGDSITTENGDVVHIFENGATEETAKNYTTTFESDTNKPTTSEVNSTIANTNTDTINANTVTQTNSSRLDLDKDATYTDIHKTERHEFGDSSLRSVATGIKEERQISFFNLYAVIFSDVMMQFTNRTFDFD